MSDYGYQLEWIPAGEVRAGDRLACLLADARCFPEVTGWADREIDLTRHDLGVITHRTFTVKSAPWWAGDDMRTVDLAREALIVKRGQDAATYAPGHCVVCGSVASLTAGDGKFCRDCADA